MSDEAGPSCATRSQASQRPLRAVTHHRHHVSPPPHHVVQPGNSWRESVPLLPTLMPTQDEKLYSSEKTSVFLDADPTSTKKRHKTADGESSSGAGSGEGGTVRVGFQNPWDSWHKPTLSEVWNGLRWSKGDSGQTGEMDSYARALEEARMRESGRPNERQEDVAETSTTTTTNDVDVNSIAAELQPDDLSITSPDFSPSEKDATMVRATWLGHASVLLQLPALRRRRRSRNNNAHGPVRILFDPIFSLRCSPTQYFGPVRLYPAPCSVSALPRIDVVCISHSHYDHLDYDSIVQLWRANASHIRFVVPLGNRAWFLGLGLEIEEDRVIELDWWDEVWMTDDVDTKDDGDRDDDEAFQLRFICTPAQHGSGRYGFDSGRSLWSSWTVERRPIKTKSSSSTNTFRAFFGGDTGFQFHSSSPQPTHHATCPAFEEVRRVVGSPHLSFLPISVGATLNFVKSYDSFGLVPELDSGLTGSNHLTPFDAVRVAKILAGQGDTYAMDKPDADSVQSDTRTSNNKSVVTAIHWGTFVSGLEEVRKSMRELEAACMVQDVRFVRHLDERTDDAQKDERLAFACIDHGQTVWVAAR